MPRPRPFAAVLSLALATPLLLLTPSASAAVPVKPYDFNHDGFPELVVGVPHLKVGTVQAGGVVVLRASASGVSLDERVITQDTAGVPGKAAAESRFGHSVTSADFDRDGYADLAVGGASELRGSGSAVTILFGSADGLTGARAYDLGGQSREADQLQAADLDGDGWVDLAAGFPDADDPNGDGAKAPGEVRVYRGSAKGFAAGRSSVLRGQRQGPAVDLRFGSALGVGDLDGDGVSDLAVTSPGLQGFDDDDEGYQNPGSVSVCYGAAVSGPTGCTRLAHGFRYAGSSTVSVGNVSGDSRPEIVTGIPDTEAIYDPTENYQDKRTGGAVEILALSGKGAATTAEPTTLTQDSKGVRGSGEPEDGFGWSVALGDLDRDGFADLVIGASREDVGKKQSAGRVTVVYGAKKGHRTSGGKVYDQGTKGIPGKPEESDNFGDAVSLVDHDADGHLDLAVGAPFEDGSPDDGYPGAVTTLNGSGRSFTTKKAQTFGLRTLGYAQADGSELFGQVLGG